MRLQQHDNRVNIFNFFLCLYVYPSLSVLWDYTDILRFLVESCHLRGGPSIEAKRTSGKQTPDSFSDFFPVVCTTYRRL